MSLHASHLRDFGTNVTLPLAYAGSCNATVIADAQLTLLAEISAVKDQAQSLQAASTLSLPQLLGSTRTFFFDLQQLILQFPVEQKHENKYIKKGEANVNMSSNDDTEVLTVSSSPLASSISRPSAAPSGSFLFHVPAERRGSDPSRSAPLVSQLDPPSWQVVKTSHQEFG